MKIALNKTYLTDDGKQFSPVRTRRGDKIMETRNMLGGRKWTGYYYIIFVDKDGNEYMKGNLKSEIKT